MNVFTTWQELNCIKITICAISLSLLCCYCKSWFSVISFSTLGHLKFEFLYYCKSICYLEKYFCFSNIVSVSNHCVTVRGVPVGKKWMIVKPSVFYSGLKVDFLSDASFIENSYLLWWNCGYVWRFLNFTSEHTDPLAPLIRLKSDVHVL